MFVSKDLVFVELHKTGGSHIGRLLKQFVGGEQIGKHNCVPENLYDRYIMGSVRNPWDWYVSLWAYGCSKQGSVFMQSSRKLDWSYYYRQLNKEMGGEWLSARQYVRQITNDLWQKPVDTWKQTYVDSENPDNFRTWLKLLLNPERALDIGEGYGFSAIMPEAGLYTYRFLKLFARPDAGLYNSKKLRLADLRNYWNEFKLVNGIIRNESLEDDFLECLSQAGIDLTDEQRAEVIDQKNNKTNTSSRKDTAFYYDSETSSLVAQKEALILELFEYENPLSS